MGFLTLSAALALGALLVLFVRRRAWERARWERARAIVIGYVEEPSPDGAPVVFAVLRYVHEGKSWFARSPVGSEEPMHAIGQELGVRVEPGGGKRIVLDALLLRWLAPSSPTYHDDEVARLSFVSPVVIDRALELRRQQRRVVGLCLLFAAAGLAWGGWTWREMRVDFLLRAETTAGRVVRWAEHTTLDGKLRVPIVQYRHPASTSPVEFPHAMPSAEPALRVGQDVRVLYAPDDPKRAMLDAGGWNLAAPHLLLAAAVLLALLGARLTLDED